MNSLGTKAALVCATTAVSVVMFAGTAFAAPQLAAGQTSGGPHDSRGNCASCHSYPAAVPTPAPTPVSTTPGATTPGTGTTITTPGSVTIIIGGVTIVISTPSASTQPAPVVTPAPTTSAPIAPSAPSNNDQGDDGGGDD